ncbi:MAG: response regulator, partial [Pseudohongiella sp.]|nr:response regulator [Pseudohongiella sp.]
MSQFHPSDSLAAHPQRPAVRLLLIEDDVRLASLVRDYLTQENFEVSIQHKGDVAVTSFDASAVDIVVLDLMLPGMN